MRAQAPITPGVRVSFDGAAGNTTGRVELIRTDISNGAKVALVSLTGGGTEALPINHLRQEETK